MKHRLHKRPYSTQSLHSGRRFHRHAAALLNYGFNLLESWEGSTPLVQFLVAPAVCLPSGSELPRSLWVALNKLRTGVGRFGTCLYPVVCLRGGERGTCLGPPLFGVPPLRYYAHKFSLFLVKDVLFTHVMCYKANHKQVFCFQRAPY